MMKFFNFLKENVVVILLLVIVVLNFHSEIATKQNTEEIEEIKNSLEQQRIINEKIPLLNERIKELEKK